MKKLFISIFLVFMVASAKANPSAVDPSLLPITSTQLDQALWANKNDAAKLAVTIRQAFENKYLKEVFFTLNHICETEPQNAVALAGYCMVYDVAFWKSTIGIKQTPQGITLYGQRLKKARELAPESWFPYMVEGYGLVQNSSTFFKLKDRERGINLMRKAVLLAPQSSYAHYALGQSYYLISLRTLKSKKPNNLRAQWTRKAVYHFEKSVQAQPSLFHAAFELFNINHFIYHDRKKAAKYGNAMVAMMPRGKKVNKDIQSRLAQYGIKVEAFKES